MTSTALKPRKSSPAKPARSKSTIPGKSVVLEQQLIQQYADLVATCGHHMPARTPPPTYCNSTMGGSYSAKQSAPTIRQGADKALSIPSRTNDRLHHRDGTVTGLHGERRPELKALAEQLAKENPRWSTSKCLTTAKQTLAAKFLVQRTCTGNQIYSQ